MKILHYALGFPPYRTGGMTKFCMDIMSEQNRLGHKVSLLWPGRMNLINKSVRIKKHKHQNAIGSYEIINPLPISYDEGIIDIQKFCKACDKNVYNKLLCKLNPNVIHIHTFMGIHKEFLEAAQELNIKIVFTIHDFFALCPKVTMFYDGKICKQVKSCEQCPQCNLTALSMSKIYLLQHPLYRLLKNSVLIKKLRKRHRDQYLSGKNRTHVYGTSVATSPEDYRALRNYYGSMVKLINVLHANSTVTKNIFTKIYKTTKVEIISISHINIQDHRRRKDFSKDKLRITYLGPASRGKGYFLLKKALDKLWKENQQFLLNIFFEPETKSPYMVSHGRYRYSDLEGIFEKTDVLIAPSIWYETFGYTVLEALSYGVPVIVSDNVGAKDIISKKCGIIVNNINSENLYITIKNLTAAQLSNMNKNIINSGSIITLQDMTAEIMDKCYQ